MSIVRTPVARTGVGDAFQALVERSRPISTEAEAFFLPARFFLPDVEIGRLHSSIGQRLTEKLMRYALLIYLSDAPFAAMAKADRLGFIDAIRLAGAMPLATVGSVEVRPIKNHPGEF